MTHLLNYRKILLSATMIAFVASLVFAGTQAFFSDEEASTGNVFAAGAIDLRIDNHAWYNGLECTDEGNDPGDYVWQDPGNNAGNDPYLLSLIGQPCQSTWELKDLESGDLFFNLTDLKPGDWEEDTISFHVDNNDAWVCANLKVTEDDDVSSTEPELEDGDDPEDDQNPWDGELGQELNFIFWADDGDNVYEDDETVVLDGTPSDLDGYGSDDNNNGETFPLADSDFNVWQDGQPNSPLPAGNDPVYIGKAFCFGDFVLTPVPQGDNSPADDPGFTCDGTPVTNISQTDRMMGDLRFYAVQSRNNPDFICTNDLFPEEEEERDAVGAALGAYSAPTCGATVSLDESIQAANDTASPGDVICVDPSYTGVGDTYPVTLDVLDLTVAGLGSAGDADIPGGFFIDNSGITVTGLEFTDYSFIASSEDAAIYIHNEPGQGAGVDLTGTTISYNIFTAPGGAKADDANGIITEIGSASAIASGISVMHNSFSDWRRGAFFNPANYEVAYNTFTGNDVGVANDGPHSSSIHHNNFDGNVLEAVGVAPSATGATSNDGSLVVNTNNLGPAGAGNNVNWYGVSVFGGADVDATGNWWDSEAEGDRTNDTSEVDTSSPEAVAFPIN